LPDASTVQTAWSRAAATTCGCWSSWQEIEAARAYDRALVRLRGRSAATNFAMGDYRTEMSDHHQWQARTLKADER
jgi:hypothetical protein